MVKIIMDGIFPRTSFGISWVLLSVRHDNISNENNFGGPIFQHFEPVVILEVPPPVGSIKGGTKLLINTITLSPITDLVCLLGDKNTEAEFLNQY